VVAAIPTKVSADEGLLKELRVVLIDGDIRVARLTAQSLMAHGMTVSLVLLGHAAVAEVQRVRPDIVLLEATLPDLDGYAVCRDLRERFDVPIMMLTARGEEADRLMGFKSGADDYVTKPFSLRELLARIGTHVRRARGHVGRYRDRIAVGELQLDLSMKSAHLSGKWLSLTAHEFNLLRILAERAGHPVPRDLLQQLLNSSSVPAFERSIDVHISRLRRKLEADNRHPNLLKTVRGVGYMMARQR
jgi:DNA-binding response OmpR family regulator